MGSGLVQTDISNPLVWYDSHCHFNFAEFDDRRDDIVRQLIDAHCGGVLVPATTAQQWPQLLALHKTYPKFIHLALGLHPYFMEQHVPAHLAELEALLTHEHKQVVAVGEIGLDFFAPLDAELPDPQIALFNEQLNLAKQFKLPVIIHSRKAHDDVAKILRLTHFTQGGIVHGFSGSVQQAKAFADLGFLVGLGGALTHQRANAMRALVKALGPDQFVLETDAPDMRPAFALDQPNSPLNLPRITAQIAQLRDETLLQVCQNTTQNLYRVIPRIKPTFGTR